MNVPTNPAGWKWQWQLTALGTRQESDRAQLRRTSSGERPPSCRSSSRTARPCLRARRPPTGSTGSTTSPSASPSTSPRRSTPVTTSSSRTPRRSPRRSRRRSPCPRVRTGSRPGTTCTLENPQNQVGHVNGSADPGQRPGRDPRRESVLIEEQPDPPRLRLGGHRQDLGRHPRQRHPARLHHDSDAHLLQRPSPGRRPQTARRTRQLPPSPSYMGFWYLNAGLGPKTPCATSSGTPPRFDTVSGTPDNTINQSAYLRGQPVRSHRRLLQLHVGGRPDEARVGRNDPHDQGNRLHRREREEHVRNTRSTSARGRSSSAGATRWTTTPRSA